jgi:uncharacterized membrane protein YcaP (DUF421 family)
MLKVLGRFVLAIVFANYLLRITVRHSLTRMSFMNFMSASMIGDMLGRYTAGRIEGNRLLVFPAVVVADGMFSDWLMLKNRQAQKIIRGQPLVIIKNGQMVRENMSKTHYNINDILMLLREKGIFNLNQVEFAVLETNGSLSVLKRSQHRPVTPGDLQLSTSYEGLYSVLVYDGHILDHNLKQNYLNRSWLQHELSKRGFKDAGQIFLALLNTDCSLYLTKKQTQIPKKEVQAQSGNNGANLRTG